MTNVRVEKEKGTDLMLPDSEQGTFRYFHCCNLSKKPKCRWIIHFLCIKKLRLIG